MSIFLSLSGHDGITRFLRVMTGILTVLILSSLSIFILIELAPGDPYVGWSEELKSAFGVYDPLPVQYLKWLAGIFVFDLGNSIYQMGHPVSTVVSSAYATTILIVSGGLLFSLVIALPLGTASAHFPENRLIQLLIRCLELISSTPVFILGFAVFFIALRYLNFNLVIREDYTLVGKTGFYLVLFVILGIGNGAVTEFIKQTENEVSRIRKRLYMLAVRARSVSYYRHLAVSAASPLIILIHNRFVYMLSSAVILEFLFTIRGVGLLSIDAARSRDYPLILGITVFTIFVVLAVRAAGNLIVQQLNPVR